MSDIPPQPPEAPPGCLFLAWAAVVFAGVLLASIVLDKLFPFLFPK